MRLIDADALIERLEADAEHMDEPVGKMFTYAAISDVKHFPTAVEVVRCDDCVYYGSRRWCELHSSVFDDNAFCSYGERRKE